MEPRTTLLRDAGVIYHLQRQAGADYWRAWMLGQELQVMKGHMGDYWRCKKLRNSLRNMLLILTEKLNMNNVAHDPPVFLIPAKYYSNK